MRSRSSLGSLAAMLVIVPFLASGCRGEDVDIAQALQVTDVTTGWFDAGIVEDGKNKLVPSISFRLQNAHDSTVSSVQMIAKFSRVGETEEWGSGPFVRAVGPDGLEPGRATDPIVLRSNLGYTGEEPRGQMLRNSNFVDARIELFAKHHADNWVKLGEYQIERQLLTR
ncbi:MAG TPA: hypothetical protein VK911_18020 [Vicinamibacterales bacterium]|nr:hypothetical protein [Vicinamibacterales bacterium]